MNIHIIDPEVRLEYLDYVDPSHSIFSWQGDVDREKIETLIVRTVTQADKELLDQYPNLSHICRVWVWLDNIDTDECAARNIEVHNTPGANSSAVADLALRGILSILRKWYDWATDLIVGEDIDRSDYLGQGLEKLHIGMLWFGNVGKQIYQRLYGCWAQQVSVYDPYVDLTDFPETSPATIQEILSDADLVILAMPLTDETKEIIKTSSLQTMKNTVLLVNIGRWGLVHEWELIQHLQTHPEVNYFADVWVDDILITDVLKKLVGLPNTLITPHIWSFSEDAQRRMHYFWFLAN